MSIRSIIDKQEKLTEHRKMDKENKMLKIAKERLKEENGKLQEKALRKIQFNTNRELDKKELLQKIISDLNINIDKLPIEYYRSLELQGRIMAKRK